MSTKSPKKILFMLTGSIAAYKACDVISKLVQQGHEVQTAASTACLTQFIGPATLEGLSSKPVFSNSYAPGQMMDHINLTRWADVAILCPTTAKSINHLAAGTLEGAIGDLSLAWELGQKPFLIAPAMNTKMWQHPATQNSITKLKEWGMQIIEPLSGSLACGECGEGRLAEPVDILKVIEDL